MDPIKVIVFENYPNFRKTINEALDSIPGLVLVENEINNADAALDMLSTEKPEVVILGQDFPGNEGYQFTQTIRQEVPGTQVIIIADIASAESVRQAMRAGACDFQTYKKLSDEELSQALEHASKLAAEERKTKVPTREKAEAPAPKQPKAGPRQKARVITVYGPKGGVGTSTVTTNLSCVLASMGNKVLVIDDDLLFGDMDVLLNQRSNHSIADLVRFRDALDADIIGNVINEGKVDLIASPSSADDAVEVTGEAFDKILPALLKLKYDYILINTTSHMADATITALEKADSIILVGTQEISSIRAIRMFINLSKKLDFDPEKVILVINKFENASALTLKKMTKSLEMEISHTIAADYDSVLYANNLGRPLVIDDIDLPISKDFVLLANIVEKGKLPQKKTSIQKIFQQFKKGLAKR